MHSIFVSLAVTFLPALLTVLPAHAAEDSYPSRTIRWIVPYPPGGTTDILARIMAQRLSERIGQQVVVDNRGGAGNNIGTDIALKAQPDGYTLLLVNPANAINATLYTKLPFDFLRDYAPVAGIIRVPNDGELADAFINYFPDAADRQRILVDNPARLYGFE